MDVDEKRSIWLTTCYFFFGLCMVQQCLIWLLRLSKFRWNGQLLRSGVYLVLSLMMMHQVSLAAAREKSMWDVSSLIHAHPWSWRGDQSKVLERINAEIHLFYPNSNLLIYIYFYIKFEELLSSLLFHPSRRNSVVIKVFSHILSD